MNDLEKRVASLEYRFTGAMTVLAVAMILQVIARFMQ